jgi:hypothetical protein
VLLVCTQACVSPEDGSGALSALTCVCARLALAVLGFSLRVDGTEHIAAAVSTRGRFGVVANAQSYLDALVLAAVLGPLPLGARGAPARGAPGALLLGGAATYFPPLAFPEGAHTSGGCMLPFRPEAFPARGDAAVLPIALAYSAANSFNAAWAAHVGVVATVAHAFRLTAAWMKCARVQVLPRAAPAAGQDGAMRCVRRARAPWCVDLRLFARTLPDARSRSQCMCRSDQRRRLWRRCRRPWLPSWGGPSWMRPAGWSLAAVLPRRAGGARRRGVQPTPRRLRARRRRAGARRWRARRPCGRPRQRA